MVMAMREALQPPVTFTPGLVHPTTGNTITSYKKLMNEPETVEVWQMAFGKDLGGMAQGDEKNRTERHQFSVCDDT
jgi:hypothetical protein